MTNPSADLNAMSPERRAIAQMERLADWHDIPKTAEDIRRQLQADLPMSYEKFKAADERAGELRASRSLLSLLVNYQHDDDPESVQSVLRARISELEGEATKC